MAKRATTLKAARQNAGASQAGHSPVTATQATHNPLYVQIKQMLFERLRKGEWGPGELLPSEIKLAAQYNVHQGTIRKALDEITAQRLLVRQQGKGTFVTNGMMRHRPYYFLRIQPRSGANQPPATEFLSCKRAKASAEEQRMLQSPVREVIRLAKLRRFDSKPVIVERISIRGDMFPGLETLLDELRPETTYTLLEQRYRVLIPRVVERLGAVAASAEDAKLLALPKGAPLLQIDRIAYSLAGTPIEWRVSRCNAQSHEYLVELT
jgi:GntR family transcriptional regulator